MNLGGNCRESLSKFDWILGSFQWLINCERQEEGEGTQGDDDEFLDSKLLNVKHSKKT